MGASRAEQRYTGQGSDVEMFGMKYLGFSDRVCGKGVSDAGPIMFGRGY